LTAPHTSGHQTPRPVFEDPDSDFHGLTAIEYQGEIIYWLQREYGAHVQVRYSLYKELLEACDQGHKYHPLHSASLSDQLLINRVIRRIVHDDAWFLPASPEFAYGCLIRIRGTSMYVEIEANYYECRWRRRIL
jgi:hypothetical protein